MCIKSCELAYFERLRHSSIHFQCAFFEFHYLASGLFFQVHYLSQADEKKIMRLLAPPGAPQRGKTAYVITFPEKHPGSRPLLRCLE
jgi:hypothetical protein